MSKSGSQPGLTRDAYVLQECIRIANDPSESAERRRKAEKWARTLVDSAGSNWEGGGQTVAETAGIKPNHTAPGGQKVSEPGGYAGLSRNSGRVPDIDSGELSSELHSGQRGRYGARERSLR